MTADFDLNADDLNTPIADQAVADIELSDELMEILTAKEPIWKSATEMFAAIDAANAQFYQRQWDRVKHLPISASVGRSAYSNFKNATHSREAFIAAHLHHVVRKSKDGPAICGGTLIDDADAETGKNFVNDNIGEVWAVYLDFDDGSKAQDVSRALEGIAHVLYSTHSHGKHARDVPVKALRKFMTENGRGDDEPTPDDIKGYLRKHDNRINAEQIDSVHGPITTATKQKHGTEIAYYEYQTAPFEKFRVVILFDAPFIARCKITGKSRKKLFSAAIDLLASEYDLNIDESCRNLARLMYLPSRASEKAPHFAYFKPGRLLDFNAIAARVSVAEDTSKKPRAERASTTKSVHAQSEAVGDDRFSAFTGGKERSEFKTKRMALLLATCSQSLDIVAFIADKVATHPDFTHIADAMDPDDIDEDEGRVFCPCPNAHGAMTGRSHSDVTEKQFSLISEANRPEGSEHKGAGFHIYCFSNGCKVAFGDGDSVDRGLFLDRLCELLGIEDAAALLLWCSDEDKAKFEAASSEPIETLEDIKADALKLSPTTSGAEIDAILDRIVKHEASAARADVEEAVRTQTGKGKVVFAVFVKRAESRKKKAKSDSGPTTGAADGDFERNQQGSITTSAANIRRLLAKMTVTVRYNEFTGRTEIVGLAGFGPLLDDAAILRLAVRAEDEYDMRVSTERVLEIVSDTARQNAYHPIKDYLGSLKWDGKPRVDTWITDYMGAEDTPLNRQIGSKFLIAGVRRVFQPGCKFDTVTVFEGLQGKGKSTLLQVLAGGPDYFTDGASLAADQQRVIEQTRGKWIAEIAEFHGGRKTDVEHAKALLSRQVDSARMAYGRLTENVPRQFIFASTVNGADYLRDTTGNRRFHPVATMRADFTEIAHVRDQLWAEAVEREKSCKSLHIDPELYEEAAKVQASRMVENPFVDELGVKLDGVEGIITAFEVKRLLGLTGGRGGPQAQLIKAAMEALGWSSHKGAVPDMRGSLSFYKKGASTRVWKAERDGGELAKGVTGG